MTTIAYRKGILAGDTRVTHDGTVLPGAERKVFVLPDGSLFASADDAEGGELLLRAMRKGHAPPRLTGDMNVEAILVKPNGSLFFYEGSVWIRHRAPYVAIGSGRAFALGAMACGASAIEAVKVGMRFDAYSGGRVLTVKLRKH